MDADVRGKIQMRIQKPLKHARPRKQVSSRIIKEIQLHVEAASKEFKVSKSFVVSVALADFFGIKKQERFY